MASFLSFLGESQAVLLIYLYLDLHLLWFFILQDKTNSRCNICHLCLLRVTITHPLQTLYRWGITLHSEIWWFGACLTGIFIQILYMLMTFYCSPTLGRDDNLILLLWKCLSVNIDRTKVMVFNITGDTVTRSEPELLLGEEKVAYTRSYTYFRVNIHRCLILLTGSCLCSNFAWICSPWLSSETMCTYTAPRGTN